MLCNDISMNSPRFNSCVGSDVKPVYHTKILKDGTIELECVGYESLQDKIEAERNNTELHVLIARYENGDLLALNSKSGFYADVTKFPGSITDAMNVVLGAESEFAQLPVDIKKEFANDWKKWLAQFGSDDWLKFMKPVYSPEKVDEKESEVKNDEE